MDVRFWFSGISKCTVAGFNSEVPNDPWSKLYIVTDGQAAYAICRPGYEWQKTTLVPGFIYLIPGSCAHRAICASDFDLNWCHFTVENELQSRLAMMTKVHQWPLSNVHSDAADIVHQASWNPQSLRAAALTLSLLAELPDPVLFELATERARINPAISHLQIAFACDHRIDELARRCNLHATRFQQLFRLVLNTTPGEYLVQLRLAEACRLLANSTLSIAVVGEMVGWVNPYHFSRIFRTKIGASPRAWRAQHAGNARLTPSDPAR